MSLGSAFCIACGTTGELTSERLCEGCFRGRTTLSKLPDTLQCIRCPKCQMVLRDGRWADLVDDDLQHDLVEEALSIDARAEQIGVALASVELDERNYRVNVQVNAVIDGMQFDDEHSLIVRTSDGICPTCSRRAGNYFEATVQLRSSGRRLSPEELTNVRETLDDLLAEMEPDPMFFITKEGSVTGGWDVVLGSKSLARIWAKNLVRRFGGRIIETNSVVGRKDGEDITRLTVLYRKPAFSIGDIIRWRNGDWIVATWQKDGATLHALDRRQRTGATWRDLEKANVLSTVQDQVEVDLLNRDSSAGEFLDPRDWKMRAIALPFNDDGLSTKLRIALIADEWVAVPNISAQ